MIRRVGIAQAMINDPKVLVLDEPTAGLDPNERIRFRNLISEIARDKIVLLSTHIVSDVEHIAEEVIMINKGKIFFESVKIGSFFFLLFAKKCQMIFGATFDFYIEKY